ncbi:MAG: hypothetical protein LBU62_03295 [Bacteroidales bacterium]|jgi:hypothetical protein|nr:hypothetical protein [Bacteroidales bacterium]
MSGKKNPFCLLFLLWGCLPSYAQFYESGVNPPSVRWQQINTTHFRVISPVDICHEGQRAANVLEYIYASEGKSLNHRPAKVSVVLHNRPAFSNGIVTWAPKRSEWYLTAPYDNYAHNWMEQLALHEYRHVVQIDKLNQGFTKGLGYLIGQQAVGLASAMTPYWYLEGDAVLTETALSNSGRGRNPAFEMPLRTIALSTGRHSYDKAAFGSYRHHVPNHYEWGYQMVAWTKRTYGMEVFSHAENDVARRPFLFFPFSIALKKQTGMWNPQRYGKAFDELTEGWKKQTEQTPHVAYTPVNRPAKHYTSYRSPRYINDSVFVAIKTGMAQIAQLVEVSQTGKERVLHAPGFINTDLLSYSAGWLAWTEEIPDVRWSNRSYSVVKLMNIISGKVYTRSRHTRYFAPALSPDATKIVVVDMPLDGTSAIVVLNTDNGEAGLRIEAPDNAQWQTPAWCKDGKQLLAIVNGQQGKAIVRIDAATGLFTLLLSPVFDNISHPVDGGTCVFFTGHYNGINNIYAVNYQTLEVKQVTAASYGAFDPQPDAQGVKLLFADYSVNGYKLVETETNENSWIPIHQVENHSLRQYQAIAKQENFNLQDSIIPSIAYPVKPFRKWQHLFNIHSWAPLYYKVNVADVSSTKFYPGLVVMSQDLLGNMTSSAGYSWRDYHCLHTNLVYRGLYPALEFNIQYGGNRGVYGKADSDFRPVRPEVRTSASVYIPFNFTRSRWITGMEPRVSMDYSSNYLYSQSAGGYQFGLLEAVYRMTFYRYQKAAMRDLAPRWGVVLQAALKNAPLYEGQFGYMYNIYGRFYLPGVAKHHSLQLSGGWQQQKAGEYIFGSMLAFPRGYVTGHTEQLSIGLAEYRFPFLYPDKNLTFLVYLKRLSANLFCHAAGNRYQTRSGWQSDQMLSIGADILADVHFLRLFFPVNIGIRTVYVPATKDIQPSLLFSVSFN